MKELNLIPYQLKEKTQKHYEVRKYISITAVIIVILITSILLPLFNLSNSEKEESRLKAESLKSAEILTENKSINQQIDNMKKYTDQENLVTKNKILSSDKIRGIEKYFPSGVTFLTLDYTKTVINVSGSSKTYNAVSELIANLQTSADYKSSKIVDISYDSAHTIYNFKVTIGL